MITGKKEELDQYVKTHRCPEHDNPLVVAWHADENSYVIRCGAGHFPEEIVSIKSRTQQYKSGELEPAEKPLSLLPKADLETGEALRPDQVMELIAYAERYGLDAYRGHVLFMHGTPYIGLDGYLYHANKTKAPYTLTSRPLTPGEKELYMIQTEVIAWIANVDINKGEHMFQGLGIVTPEEMTAMSKRDKTKLRSPVVAAHPWQMAQKRAEWQALRRAFPIGESDADNV